MELLALVVAVIALLVAAISLGLLLHTGRASAGDALGGARYGELERRLGQVGHRLEALETDVDAHRDDTSAEPRSNAPLTARAGAAISHVGLVRFDAFADAGGGQSFALALLDDEGDGFVLTSLHSRQSTRLYLKDIRRGVADAPLSTEEKGALHEAGLAI